MYSSIECGVPSIFKSADFKLLYFPCDMLRFFGELRSSRATFGIFRMCFWLIRLAPRLFSTSFWRLSMRLLTFQRAKLPFTSATKVNASDCLTFLAPDVAWICCFSIHTLMPLKVNNEAFYTCPNQASWICLPPEECAALSTLKPHWCVWCLEASMGC